MPISVTRKSHDFVFSVQYLFAFKNAKRISCACTEINVLCLTFVVSSSLETLIQGKEYGTIKSFPVVTIFYLYYHQEKDTLKLNGIENLGEMALRVFTRSLWHLRARLLVLCLYVLILRPSWKSSRCKRSHGRKVICALTPKPRYN